MTKYYKSKFYKNPIEVENIGGEIFVIIKDSLGRESIYTWYDIEEKTSQSPYINKCLLGGFLRKTPKKTLIIGIGGGAFGKYLEDHIKNINITGIDIDETMIEIAKKELSLKTNDIYINDALFCLDEIINKKEIYDLILIDVYAGDGKTPKYFEEEIFFEKLKKLTNKETTISINFSNYDEEINFYNKVHNNLIKTFGGFYAHLLAGKNDRSNISGIYNLDKKYFKKDFRENYLKKVKNSEILYDENIIKNIYLK